MNCTGVGLAIFYEWKINSPDPVNSDVMRHEMIIVLLDEPGLFVFESLAEAEFEIEPIDAESEIRAVFDDKAVPYEACWERLNIHRKGIFGSIQPGEYHLVPAGPAQPAKLARLIQSHPLTDPPEAKTSLTKLLNSLIKPSGAPE